MKKENMRNFTVRQLEKRLKRLSAIGVITFILAILMVFEIMIFSTDLNKTQEILTDWKFIFLLFLVIIMLIITTMTVKLNNMIKIRVIKDCAEYGMLRESATIKSQSMIEKLLSRSIEEISIYKEDNKMLMVIIQFAGNMEDYQFTVPVNKFLSIINEETKKELLEKLVKDIQFDTETNKLIIRSANKKLYGRVISDNDLLEIFEYKND